MNAPQKTWQFMTAAEKDAAVKPLILAGESYGAVASRFGAPDRHCVAGVVARLRKAGQLPEGPGKSRASSGRRMRDRINAKAAKAKVPLAEPLPPLTTQAGTPDWRRMDPARRDELLIGYCHEGLSAGQIASKFFDASRSAVIGRVHRLQHAGQKIALQAGHGKRGPGNKAKASKPPKSAAPGKPAGEPKLPRALDLPKTKPHPGNIARKAASRENDPNIIRISSAAAFDPLPGQAPVALVALTPTTCRWPVDGLEGRDGLFCGAACEVEHSYCASHRALAYHPPTYRLSVPKGA